MITTPSALASLRVLGTLGLCYVVTALVACDRVPPTVVIASPAPGAYLSGETSVMVDFEGAADYHSRVDILIETDTAPYTVVGSLEREQLFHKEAQEVIIDVNGMRDGPARLKAEAISVAGVPNGSYTIEVFIQNGDAPLPTGDGDGDTGDGDGDVDLGEDPAIDIVSPQDGTRLTVGGQATIALGVGGAADLVRVEVFAGEAYLATVREAPFVVDWDTAALPPGPVALKAVATYAGNVTLIDDDTTVILGLPGSAGDETAPTVPALSLSRTGDLPLGVTVAVNTEAADNVAVARVELFVDGMSAGTMSPDPVAGAGHFTLPWTASALGTHELVAVATDPAGNQGESAVLTVNVADIASFDDAAPPTVGSLSVSPAGPVEQGATVALSVTVTDDVGLDTVELYVNGVPAGGFAGAEPTFTLEWSTAGRSGSLSLEARALDLAGHLASSSPVTLVVQGGDVIDWTPPPAHPFAKVTSFPSNTQGNQEAPNPGNLTMYLHVPPDLPPGAPVVVVMHGCSQTAPQFRNQSGWTDLADEHKWIVIFPEQTITNDPNPQKIGNPYRCFNWAGYYGERMARGEGENQSIKEMIDWILQDDDYGADPTKVFITGFSAGGGMTNLMVATWPELFAGASTMAGIPYGCADSREDAFGCMGVTDSAAFSPRTGPGCESGEACMDPALKHDAAGWGDLVRAAGAPGYSGPYPKMILWQGDEDQYVDDDNMVELTEQWTDVHGATQDGGDLVLKPGAAEHIYKEYKVGGEVKVASVLFPGMSHGIAVDPGAGEDQGGTPANNVFSGGYAFDRDLYSAYYTAQFWGILDWSDGIVVGPGPGPGPDPDPTPDPEPETPVTTCQDWTMTVQYHLFAFPARVENVGDFIAPDYRVIGSGESLNEVNLYLDPVTIRTGDVEGEYALGACP